MVHWTKSTIFVVPRAPLRSIDRSISRTLIILFIGESVSLCLSVAETNKDSLYSWMQIAFLNWPAAHQQIEIYLLILCAQTIAIVLVESASLRVAHNFHLKCASAATGCWTAALPLDRLSLVAIRVTCPGDRVLSHIHHRTANTITITRSGLSPSPPLPLEMQLSDTNPISSDRWESASLMTGQISSDLMVNKKWH